VLCKPCVDTVCVCEDACYVIGDAAAAAAAADDDGDDDDDDGDGDDDDDDAVVSTRRHLSVSSNNVWSFQLSIVTALHFQ